MERRERGGCSSEVNNTRDLNHKLSKALLIDG